MDTSEALRELIDAAREAAEVLQVHAQKLEHRGESSSIERIAMRRINMALLALEDEQFV